MEVQTMLQENRPKTGQSEASGLFALSPGAPFWVSGL